MGYLLPSAVSGAFRFAGIPTDRLLILIYHRVHSRPDELLPQDPTARTFSWQMELLARHMKPVSLRDGLRAMTRGALPRRAVAVSFDDGYRDNLEVAAPILQRFGVPATFFVATGYLDGGRMWNDTVIESVRRLAPGRHALPVPQLGVSVIMDDGDRRRVASEILMSIKYLPPVEREAVAQALHDYCAAKLPSDLMLTTEQLIELSRRGFDIGAHTVSHPILRSLSSQDAAREMSQSKILLERITGAAIRLFAYPNGKLGEDFDPDHAEIARAIGFEAAVSTHRGVCSASSDLFQLPRFTPWDRSPERFLARLLLEFRR